MDDPRSSLLHLGCGRERLEGWINIDCQPLPGVDVVHDITQGLDFENVRAVYAEHFLEHLEIIQAIDLLLEVHRILASDGWLRLSTPNLDWVWSTHYRLDAPQGEKPQLALYLNRAFHGWQHRFLWNRELLQQALLACGFVDVRWCTYGESTLDVFQSIERHAPYGDIPELPHALIAEATKGDPQAGRLQRLRSLVEEKFLNHMKS